MNYEFRNMMKGEDIVMFVRSQILRWMGYIIRNYDDSTEKK